jgi:sirohydrochlorin cobaltochelatase
MTTGLILFGHGARDARWREPFDRLLKLVGPQHAGPVSQAFLEHMQPNLPAACTALARAGATRIVVVPLFLGTGGHLREDVPALVSAAQQQAGVPVSIVTAAGEDAAVLQALAEYCLQAGRG